MLARDAFMGFTCTFDAILQFRAQWRQKLPQPASPVSGVLFPGWREPPTFPRVRRTRPTRFVAETVSRPISAVAVMKISDYHRRLFPEIAFGRDLPLFPKEKFGLILAHGQERTPAVLEEYLD
jgi:hypothetical protein